jgi:hypothetical protein
MLEWFLDKDVLPVYNIQGTPRTALHLLAFCIPYSHENRLELMLKLNDICDPTSTDLCDCYCSSYGCMPIHMQWKRCNRINYQDSWGWGRRQKESNQWVEVCRLRPITQEVYFAELCRLELFERLGMAHTCCNFEDNDPYGDFSSEYYGFRMKGRISDEDRDELQAEDAELYKQLTSLMEVYRTL